MEVNDVNGIQEDSWGFIGISQKILAGFSWPTSDEFEFGILTLTMVNLRGRVHPQPRCGKHPAILLCYLLGCGPILDPARNRMGSPRDLQGVVFLETPLFVVYRFIITWSLDYGSFTLIWITWWWNMGYIVDAPKANGVSSFWSIKTC